MASDQSWVVTLQAVFPAEFERIVRTVHTYPEKPEIIRLFLDLASHVQTTKTSSTNGIVIANKKRKLEDRAEATGAIPSTANTITNPVTEFECKDVSLQIPARKKMKLQLVKDERNSTYQQLCFQHAQSQEPEYTLPFDQIDHVFCLPVPEKQQRQWNFCVFPKVGASGANGAAAEQILWTINETAPLDANWMGHEPAADDTYLTITEKALNSALAALGKQVVRPSKEEFESSIVQMHRKNEKAYHVKAHRGSKDGYLFFLKNGIFFGFKKPIAFFPFSAISSISYTSVLQRTFNLVITTMSSDGDVNDQKDVEFSMLDQADFAGIDEYIKRHELNDASMAEQRRAKEYGVNKEKKSEATDGEAPADEGEDDMTELQKAEQQLQDEEDELEEDYEASGGESDGSGVDSDEEDDDDEAQHEEGPDEDEEADDDRADDDHDHKH